MLVLTRRVGEVIHLGDDIEIAVLDVKGNQVRVGIEAPPDLVILRKELVAEPAVSETAPWLKCAEPPASYRTDHKS